MKKVLAVIILVLIFSWIFFAHEKRQEQRWMDAAKKSNVDPNVIKNVKLFDDTK